MGLTSEQIESLLGLVELTQENEINCERCLALVAEFAECSLEGQSVPEALRSVEHHLSICAECQEEFEALKRALREYDESGGH